MGGIVSEIMFFCNFDWQYKYPAFWMLPAFYILFGVLCFVTENQVGKLGHYCKFLTVPLGKGVFFLYMGTLLCYYRESVGNWDVWPSMVLVVAILFFLMCVLNILFHFCGREKVEQTVEEYKEKLVNS